MKLMFLLVVLIPGSIFLSRRKNIQQGPDPLRSHLILWLRVTCFLILGVTIALGFSVAFKDQALHDETAILSGAAGYLHGYPLYPLSSSPVEYGLLYGPATYLVYTPVLMPSTRLTLPLIWAAFAFNSALIVFLLTVRSMSNTVISLVFTIVLLAFLAPFLPYLLAAKADAWIVLAIALGFPAARLKNKWCAIVAIALLGAALTDFKFTLLLAGLLPCVSLWRRGKDFHASALIAAVLVPSIAMSVFLLPGISFEGYREQLALASHHGLSIHLFLRNLPFAMYLLLPGICLATQLGLQSKPALLGWIKDQAASLVGVGAVFILAMITGAKYGAGSWHLEVVCIPLALLSAELFTLLWRVSVQADIPYTRVLATPFAIVLVLLGNILIGWQRGIQARVRGPQLYAAVSMPEVERELIDILRTSPGKSFSMGYTDLTHYNLTSVRPLLQERGMPILIDPVTRNEDDLAGKPLNPAVVQAVANCMMPHWILPREGEPFSLESMYYLDGSIAKPELYPKSISETFLSHYHRVSESRYFAIWDCNERDNPT